MAHDPLIILQDLIRCVSVTPQDGGAIDVVGDALAQAGFTVTRRRFGEGEAAVENLYARFGDARPCLLFAGHTDVVPPGDEASWTHPPFSGEVRDGMIHGRGASDMKGGIACMMAAALDFVEARPGFAGSIAFLITGDEEGPAVNGTVKLLEWALAQGETFDHCILGEPTNPDALGEMMKIGRRGSLTGDLVVHGKQGHVAYPHLAQNPIRGLMALVGALTSPALDQGTEHFGPSNLEPVTVDVGNGATNVIPAQARATFNIRFNDLWTPSSLETELRRRLDEAAGGIAYTLSLRPTNSLAFLTSPGPFTDLLAAAIEDETGRRPALSTTGGTSDARFIKSACPVVEFGLVGQTMHQVNECVAVADLPRLTNIYRLVLERYFQG